MFFPHAIRSPISAFPMLLGAALAAGCASAPPNQYRELDSTHQLLPNTSDSSGHIPYMYSAPNTDWGMYTAVSLDPVAVYSGTDNQFAHTSDSDREQLAAYMQKKFTETLGEKYGIGSGSGPSVLRIHVTLTGDQITTPGIATITKLFPVGIVVNSVQTARDKQAVLTGSVSYAVEIYDSTSNRLLRAYVAKQYPAAENVFASFSSLGASRTGIDKGATALLKELN